LSRIPPIQPSPPLPSLPPSGCPVKPCRRYPSPDNHVGKYHSLCIFLASAAIDPCPASTQSRCQTRPSCTQASPRHRYTRDPAQQRAMGQRRRSMRRKLESHQVAPECRADSPHQPSHQDFHHYRVEIFHTEPSGGVTQPLIVRLQDFGPRSAVQKQCVFSVYF
jgi:hypothetical protein